MTPSGGVESAVPGPIALEGRGGPVDGAPVQLCDQARTAPHTVRLHEYAAQRDGNVQLGPRQARSRDESQEAFFELAPGEGGAYFGGGEDVADCRSTASPWVAGK
jgi:hypothetical protein